MMNTTVARIVEIMFQDVEKNEETDAIRDEVMNNCQERFIDLTTSGMNEDDAIAAVIESLKGMEDVLAPYKKVRRSAEEMGDMDDEESGERNVAFRAEEIHQISVCLVSEDITLEASDDNEYHVIWDADELPMVDVSVSNGVLKVERRAGEQAKPNRSEKVEHQASDSTGDFVRTEKGKIEINLDSIDGMLKSIGETLKNTFSNLHFTVGFGDSVVKIQIPEYAIPHTKLLTTSGDIDVQGVALADLNVTSTSGDINIDLAEDEGLSRAEIRTTSGDIEAACFAESATIASTSGDVEVSGRVNELTVSTISGDIDVRADVKDINFKAISGDVDMCFESVEVREVSGSTISGDIDIDLPAGVGAIAINTQTRSGDVTSRHHCDGVGPVVSGNVSSMSGDITIR